MVIGSSVTGHSDIESLVEGLDTGLFQLIG